LQFFPLGDANTQLYLLADRFIAARKRWCLALHKACYLPFGAGGGLLPRPPPDGLPVWLGPLGGRGLLMMIPSKPSG
jgi:hypothetical protein